MERSSTPTLGKNRLEKRNDGAFNEPRPRQRRLQEEFHYLGRRGCHGDRRDDRRGNLCPDRADRRTCRAALSRCLHHRRDRHRVQFLQLHQDVKRLAVGRRHRHDLAKVLRTRWYRSRCGASDGAQHGDRGKPRRTDLCQLSFAPFRYRGRAAGAHPGRWGNPIRLPRKHRGQPVNWAVLDGHGRNQDRGHRSLRDRGPVVERV